MAGFTAAAQAAPWSDWTPLADRYQGAVEYRLRDAGKKNDRGYEIQFRNKYAQKLTLKLSFVGVDAAGAPIKSDQSVALDAGDPKKGGKPTDPLRVAMATLNSIDVTGVEFAGTAPTPTPDGQPGSSVFLKKQLDAARATLRQAEADEAAAGRTMIAHNQAATSGHLTIDTGEGGGGGRATGVTQGDLVGSESDLGAARERVAAAQKRVDAIEQQLKALDQSTANPGADATGTGAGKATLTVKQINELISSAQKSAADHDWPKTSETLQTILAGSGTQIKNDERAQIETNLGVALFNGGKPTDAIAAFKEAVRLAPSDARYQNNLGSALMNEQKFADAVTAFQEAVRLDPKNMQYQDRLKAAQAAAAK